MGFGHKCDDLKSNAQSKFDDSLLLWHAGRYSNAYYLAGYAVELALKACIARQIIAQTIPDKYFLTNILSHDFGKLIGVAGLRMELHDANKMDSQFAANWALVNNWSPDARYEIHERAETQLLVEAVGNPNNGVFPWIQTHW